MASRRPGIVAGLSQRHELRTAQKEAAFLLPHLRRGMSLLDCGCGPGTITVGLAEAVARGKVVGMDFDAGRVEEATALAAKLRLTNLTFEQGDAHKLAFADESFDAVFFSAVMAHLADPVMAAKEIWRVLKNGGVVGGREGDGGGHFSYPDQPIGRDLTRMYQDWRFTQGSNMWFGRRLYGVLSEAGFADIERSMGSEFSASPEERQRFVGTTSRFNAPDFREWASKERGLTQETVDRAVAERAAWANHPDAFYSVPNIQAIGWKK